MKDSNQRLLLTVALCMGVALVWSLVFQPKPGPAPATPPAGQTQTQAQPATAPAPSPAAAPAAPQPDVPRGTSAAPRPPAQTIAFESERLHVVVTRLVARKSARSI